jgi:hypothetical protein
MRDGQGTGAGGRTGGERGGESTADWPRGEHWLPLIITMGCGIGQLREGSSGQHLGWITGWGIRGEWRGHGRGVASSSKIGMPRPFAGRRPPQPQRCYWWLGETGAVPATGVARNSEPWTKWTCGSVSGWATGWLGDTGLFLGPLVTTLRTGWNWQLLQLAPTGCSIEPQLSN